MPEQPSKPAKQRKEQESWIEIAQDPIDRLFHWCLYSANGRKIAIGVVGQQRRQDAVTAAAQAREAMIATKTVRMIH